MSMFIETKRNREKGKQKMFENKEGIKQRNDVSNDAEVTSFLFFLFSPLFYFLMSD